ncbi:MAG: DinB family protein [Flavobacterium sp.]
MDTETILKKYELHIREWIAAIENYNVTEFELQPANDAWSIGQVYDHLANVTDKCVTNALLCADNKGETGHSGFGSAIFSLMGTFPPIKMRIKKIPPGLENIYSPRQINKDEARKKLEDALQKMKNSLLLVKSADKNQRVKHWAGGWFNSQQWYHSSEMHLKHHFRQKKRIDNYLKK